MAVHVTSIELRRATLARWKKTYLDYLLMKVEQADWHGVQDAASDLRDVDAELLGLERE